MSEIELEPGSPDSQPRVIPEYATRISLILVEISFLDEVSSTQGEVEIQ